jgi:hypothetical protein
MKQTDFRYKVISLLGMAAILAIAWGMDMYLAYQAKYAAASFNYLQYFALSAACALGLIALWSGLGWLVLIKCGYSRLIWITFLVVGLIWTLGVYFYFIIPWHDVRNAIADILSARSAMVRSTSMFIAVLGLLNLALRSRSRSGG